MAYFEIIYLGICWIQVIFTHVKVEIVAVFVSVILEEKKHSPVAIFSVPV